jgi:hypothetical protein
MKQDWTGDIWTYSAYYWGLVAVNLMLAAVLSFISERPFMNFSKAVEI